MENFNGIAEEALKYIPSELLDSRSQFLLVITRFMYNVLFIVHRRALRGLKPIQSKSAMSIKNKGLDDATLQKLEQAEKTHDPSAIKEEDEEEGVRDTLYSCT